MRAIRITSSARKHGITSNRIRAALAHAVLTEVDGDYAVHVASTTAASNWIG